MVILTPVIICLSVGFFLTLSKFYEFIQPLYTANPVEVFIFPNSLTLIFWLIFIYLYIYGLVRLYTYFIETTRSIRAPEKEIEKLKKRIDALENYKETAEREFFQRRITKEVFDEIERSAEKEIIKLKARIERLSKKS